MHIMKTISLTQGFVATVDDEDYEALSRYRWKVLKVRGKLYACRSRKLSGRKYRTILMHRVIAGIPDGLLTDHKDGNGLNNCRSNLRVANHSQNAANTDTIGGTSAYKGVYWNKERGKWQAQIKIGCKPDGRKACVCLGRFDSEADAAQAYDRKSLELYGEFARPNFPSI